MLSDDVASFTFAATASFGLYALNSSAANAIASAVLIDATELLSLSLLLSLRSRAGSESLNSPNCAAYGAAAAAVLSPAGAYAPPSLSSSLSSSSLSSSENTPKSPPPSQRLFDGFDTAAAAGAAAALLFESPESSEA